MKTLEIVAGIAIGLSATLVMDLWNLFLKRAFGIASLDFGLLGRWILHLPGGTFWHPRIAAAEPKRFERSAGWIAHYTIGAAFGLGLIALAPGEWIAHPTLLPALLYGVVTVVFPYFVLQPALGLGVASARAAHPARARIKSLATHAVFGVGLFLGALAWSELARALR